MKKDFEALKLWNGRSGSQACGIYTSRVCTFMLHIRLTHASIIVATALEELNCLESKDVQMIAVETMQQTSLRAAFL